MNGVFSFDEVPVLDASSVNYYRPMSDINAANANIPQFLFCRLKQTNCCCCWKRSPLPFPAL